jgi:uncharacterized membrane protein YqjE
MASGDRSLSDVLQDIIRNVQEIVRSEVRLAKTELREEAEKAKTPTLLVGAGAVATMFAISFLLLTIVYALARVMPNWAAALIVAAALGVVASTMLTAGMKRFTQGPRTPTRTINTIQENVRWAKQQTK